MLISVCIPTYNRPEHLKNCLNSLVLQTDKKFEVCISDNSSKTNTKKIIKTYKKKLNIKFNRNKKNLGFGLNLLKVSQMASSEFVWFLGDDDLLVPSAINQLKKILKKNCDVDFVWVNSSYLDISYIRKFKSPFNTNKLPRKMKSHSNNKNSKIWPTCSPTFEW